MSVEAIEAATQNAEPLTSTNNHLDVLADAGDNRMVTSTSSTVTVTAGTTAATVFPSNPDRIGFGVALTGGKSDVHVHVRYYAAATDNLAQGVTVLTRITSANDNLLNNNFQMTQGAIYTGEISVITESGAVDVVATEY